MGDVVNLIEKMIGKNRVSDAGEMERFAKKIRDGQVRAFCVVYLDAGDEIIKTMAPGETTHDESLRMIRGLSTLIDYVLGFARTTEGQFI